ncbi:MAG TPA: hypothetical protein VJL08_03735 [Dehalococcoidia bacterium]|nr:hypothetical protein [Dehalococcoidia bacterium]
MASTVESKDWDVVKDSEEYEAFRKAMAEKRERGEKLTRQEAGKLGGLSCRQLRGYQHYRNAARKRWGVWMPHIPPAEHV